MPVEIATSFILPYDYDHWYEYSENLGRVALNLDIKLVDWQDMPLYTGQIWRGEYV